MPVIAVVNRKGGSGKSTLAAHIAAWCAHQGHTVMLGDVDRQQSSRAWLRRRPVTAPAIAPWTLDQQSVLRVPPGVSHVVLDTPGGLQGFELARVVMFADAILMPVCNSAFDRESAASCHAELLTLPRIASGRCRLAAVGMRIDRRTRAAEHLQAWAGQRELNFLGPLRETQAYVRSLDCGMTLFDLPADQAQPIDHAQWQPIIQWLGPLVMPERAPASLPTPAAPVTRPLAGSRAVPLMPAQESLICGDRLSAFAASNRSQPTPIAVSKPALPVAARVGAGGQIPPFLRRN